MNQSLVIRPPKDEREVEAAQAVFNVGVSPDYVAVDEAQIVGVGQMALRAGLGAGAFQCSIFVKPDQRRQGIGRALLAHIEFLALERGAVRLYATSRDASVRDFALTHHFLLGRHLLISQLDIASVALPEMPTVAGIRLAALAEVDSAEIRRQCYDLTKVAQRDNPDTIWRFSYADYVERLYQAPWFDPHKYFVALDGEQLVGLTFLRPDDLDTMTYKNSFTGVHPAYRGRGIAAALKQVALRYAKQNGIARFQTSNEVRNIPMLTINRRMGYEVVGNIYQVYKDL